MEKGNLSINSENFLPIIKKWLYSDTDIFIRELVSNASDAITKLKKLQILGNAEIDENEEFKVTVTVDKENKKIFIEDNGIGMTEEEVKKYINEIAFSGATDFMKKYEEQGAGTGEIIGHFGLGFYSAFMVSDVVTIDTLSYQDGEEAVKWQCDGGITYEIGKSDRTTRGTTITLHVMEEEESFLDEYKVRSILDKYCKYIPVDIYFDAVKPVEEVENTEEQTEESNDIIEVEEPKPINNKNPLWLKKPSECTEEDYKAFYKEVFMDFNEPLFWIHLNMDYPFNLKGILYFPKLNHELEGVEGQVKLYNNQVFIADNIKEVIPEFLLLLKGVLDCPDLPLNVSRSFLQNDGYVTKMSAYITKKVADKLNSLCKSERETYNKYWDDIAPFIKYGTIREKDFYDKAKDSLMFKSTTGDYYTTSEYIDKFADKTNNQIFYSNNELLHSQYIKMYKDMDIETVLLTTRIDTPFISYLEQYNNDVKFKRVDSDLTDSLKSDEETSEETQKNISTIFESIINLDDTEVKVTTLKDEEIPAVVILSEDARRMEEMSKMFGGMMMGGMKQKSTLTINSKNKLVKYLLENKDNADKKDENIMVSEHIYDLALMSHKRLSPDEMDKFVKRSMKMLSIITDVK